MKEQTFEHYWETYKTLNKKAKKPKHIYKLTGCCAQFFAFDVDEEECLHNIHIHGGCPGNTRAICKLMEGVHVGNAILCLEGIPCSRGESCANQISLVLMKYSKRYPHE